MSVIHPVLFEQSVGNLLTTAGFRPVMLKRRERPFDFVFEDREKQRCAIKVTADKPAGKELDDIADHLRFATTDIDRFILLTQKIPGRIQKRTFARAFKDAPMETVWLGGNELTRHLGISDEELDITAPETMNRLQKAAITTNISEYVDTPIALADGDGGGDISRMIQTAERRMSALPPEFMTLRRQFSFATIQRLARKKRPLDELLLIGGHIDHVTVVLSDLKNFSTLVTAAGEEPLKRIMSRYYQRSRELVWDHGGVLDKFIGDAVLAIFNYPYISKTAPMRAMAFARDLIALGSDVLGRLGETMTETVDTGTRIGICSGELWILDIGQDQIEVSFFGDTINLAARLEHNAAVDGLLMDDRTWDTVRREDPGLLDLIAPREVALPPAAVKGQGQPVRAWQVLYRDMADIEIVPDREG